MHQLLCRKPLHPFDVRGVENAGADEPRAGEIESLPHRLDGVVVQSHLLSRMHSHTHIFP
jgi:hypothetical protein